MTAPKNQPISDEDLAAFAAYYEANPTWGSLHIVLDDYNVDNCHVQSCIEYAEEIGDVEGARLGRILLSKSKSQRRRLGQRMVGVKRQRRRPWKEQQPAGFGSFTEAAMAFYTHFPQFSHLLAPKNIVYAFPPQPVGWYLPSCFIYPSRQGKTLH